MQLPLKPPQQGATATSLFPNMTHVYSIDHWFKHRQDIWIKLKGLAWESWSDCLIKHHFYLGLMGWCHREGEPKTLMIPIERSLIDMWYDRQSMSLYEYRLYNDHIDDIIYHMIRINGNDRRSRCVCFEGWKCPSWSRRSELGVKVNEVVIKGGLISCSHAKDLGMFIQVADMLNERCNDTMNDRVIRRNDRAEW